MHDKSAGDGGCSRGSDRSAHLSDGRVSPGTELQVSRALFGSPRDVFRDPSPLLLPSDPSPVLLPPDLLPLLLPSDLLLLPPDLLPLRLPLPPHPRYGQGEACCVLLFHDLNRVLSHSACKGFSLNPWL